MQKLRGYLRGLGIPTGPFRDTIRELAKKQVKKVAGSVQGTVSQNDLLFYMARDKKFKKMFPGIGVLIAKRGDGITTVSGAVAEWRLFKEELDQALRQTGATYDLTDQAVGNILKSGMAADEFVFRLARLQTLQANPGSIAAFNEVLAAEGMGPLDQNALEGFITGTAPPALTNLLEAAALRELGFSTEAARALAKGVGLEGEEVSFAAVPDALAAIKGPIEQELIQAGVDPEDVLLAATAATLGEGALTGEYAERARKAKETLEQMHRNRQAVTAPKPPQQPTGQTREGRPLFSGEEQLASIG